MGQDELSRRSFLVGAGAAGLGAISTGPGVAGAEGPDRHIVGAETKAAEEAAKRRARSVHRVIELGSYPTAIAGEFPAETRDALEDRQDVAYVEADIQYETIAETLPWGIDRIDADVAHSNGETGGDDGGDGGDGDDDPAGADVAVVDTGIDLDHPDLKANIGKSKAFQGSSPDDDNGHGTHVAGIADAVDNTEGVIGVCTEATLHAVRVCNGAGMCFTSDIAAGVEWVADQGYDVTNLSLGGDYSETVDNAGKYAYDEGVLLVAAAGNDGPCDGCVGYPAANEEFIAVGATTKDDSLADFSSTGSEVELAAPGKDIYSTYKGGGYDTLSGTSMASPHVAGAGGQLMDNGYPNAEQTSSDAEGSDPYPSSPGGARGQLQDTSEDLGLTSNEQGEGLVDVEAALGLTGLSVDSLSASEVETSSDAAEFDVSWEVSDPEGELDTLELVLYDTTADSQDDSASPSVSGGTASGTTRLVASGDEGGGHSYDVTATVTDADGNTASKTVSTSESEDTPTVESLSLSEVETSDSDAEFDADWGVSDSDGDLDTLDLTLYELDSNGNRVDTEDTVSPGISGDSASGTTRLVAGGDDGSGNTYEVEAVVSDTDGTSNSDNATATESESTSSSPSASIDGMSEANSPSPHAEFDISWSASDDDGDLDTAELTLYDDTDSETEDSASVDISGSSASGTATLKAKFDEGTGNDYTAELVVTDTNGKTDSDTSSFSEG